MTFPVQSSASRFVPSQLIAFAVSWRRFGGGPDEDIRARFGLTAPEFFVRLDRILRTDEHGLDEQTADELRTVCRRRLWMHRDASGLRPPA